LKTQTDENAEGTELPVQNGYRAWINDPRRAKQDVDFGGWWQLVWPGEAWRVSWSKQTGEVYACHPRSDRYIVFGTIPDRKEVDRLLEGWADSNSSIYRSLTALAGRFNL
jgi:hypothetical protein